MPKHECNVIYRKAGRRDLRDVARIMVSAFRESVVHYVGHPVGPAVMTDAFAICLDAEPEALIVALCDSSVAGYIYAPSDLSRVFRTALLRGHVLRMLFKWITGRYGFGLRTVAVAARNWAGLYRDAAKDELKSDARIFSIAVDPEYQGLGIGTGLTRRGLEYLRSRGAREVRLEVRPNNLPAKHIYEKYGFQTRGTTTDTQGEWLIMMKTIEAQ